MYKRCAKSMECTFLCVKIMINYPQAIFSMKLMKFTALYTATLKGVSVDAEKELIS